MLKRHLVLVALLALAVISALFVACDDNQTSEGMAIFGVSDINDTGNGSEPILASAASEIPMTFRWRPYFDTNASIVEATPHGDYVVDHYRVVWSAVGSSGTVPAPREESTNIFVPVYKLVTADIVVANATEAASNPAGTDLNANIEFTAHEMGTTKKATFSVTLTVHF
jgi:hypothetical protein